MSKAADGKAFFDQLRYPSWLSSYLGGPSVKLSELLGVDKFDKMELEQLIGQLRSDATLTQLISLGQWGFLDPRAWPRV